MLVFKLVTSIILFVLAGIIIIASLLGSVKPDDSYVIDDYDLNAGLPLLGVFKPGARQVFGYILGILMIVGVVLLLTL